MNGRPVKDPFRVAKLVKNVRPQSRPPEGASLSFFNSYNKIEHYLSNTVAKSTQNQYFLAFKKFQDFCKENCILALPSDPTFIMTYFIHLAENSNSVNTVHVARSAIRYFNLISAPGSPIPTDRDDVAMLVKSLERKFTRPVVKRTPTTPDIVRKLIDSLNGDQFRKFAFKQSISDWQIVAKCVFKFFTFSRFEEVLELKRSDFDFQSSGVLVVTKTKAKNNQFHEAKHVTISPSYDIYCPVNIIKKYFLRLNFSPLCDGFFLPKLSVKKSLVIVHPLLPTSYSFCVKQFKSKLRSLQIDDTLFGEHSDRIGGVSAAANAGCNILDIQLHGHWNSDTVPKTYINRSLQKKSSVTKTLNNLLKSSEASFKCRPTVIKFTSSCKK
jgi:integrase